MEELSYQNHYSAGVIPGNLYHAEAEFDVEADRGWNPYWESEYPTQGEHSAVGEEESHPSMDGLEEESQQEEESLPSDDRVVGLEESQQIEPNQVFNFNFNYNTRRTLKCTTCVVLTIIALASGLTAAAGVLAFQMV